MLHNAFVPTGHLETATNPFSRRLHCKTSQTGGQPSSRPHLHSFVALPRHGVAPLHLLSSPWWHIDEHGHRWTLLSSLSHDHLSALLWHIEGQYQIGTLLPSLSHDHLAAPVWCIEEQCQTWTPLSSLSHDPFQLLCGILKNPTMPGHRFHHYLTITFQLLCSITKSIGLQGDPLKHDLAGGASISHLRCDAVKNCFAGHVRKRSVRNRRKIGDVRGEQQKRKRKEGGPREGTGGRASQQESKEGRSVGIGVKQRQHARLKYSCLTHRLLKSRNLADFSTPWSVSAPPPPMTCAPMKQTVPQLRS